MQWVQTLDLILWAVVAAGTVANLSMWRLRRHQRRLRSMMLSGPAGMDLCPDSVDHLNEIGWALMSELPDNPTAAHLLVWASLHQARIVSVSPAGYATTVRFDSGHSVDLVGLSEWSAAQLARAAERRWMIVDCWVSARGAELLVGDRRRHNVRIAADVARVAV